VGEEEVATQARSVSNELAKLVLGFWGFYLFLFGVVFLFLFRSHIGSFIDRLRRFSAGKWGADATEQPEQKVPASAVETITHAQPTTIKSTVAVDERAAADAVIGELSMTPYIRSRGEQLKAVLDARGLTPGSPETYRVLTSYLTNAIVTVENEQLYSLIWTTQLVALNEANTRELTVEDLRSFYDVGAAIASERYGKYPFDDWLLWLTSQSLLHQGDGGRYSISVKGRTFLLYLIHEGRALVGRAY
jgi:hypothetical protein